MKWFRLESPYQGQRLSDNEWPGKAEVQPVGNGNWLSNCLVQGSPF